MPITLVKQYSIFLVNQPGALRDFSELFQRENVDIIAICQDLRYDAAVVRIAIDTQDESISHSLTKAGFTSVKSDAICVETKNSKGLLQKIGKILGDEHINITNVYGSDSPSGHSKLIVVVNNICKAMRTLEESGIS
ncbi:Acetolactate synthase small subunit [Elusimicrobium minutum Pei191]|uniref:Acetolactate synthase small subunit n=1 Tax=Elusimicrobium minutum (strain Pei191) TaxID=445932 RepID=B2KDR3_ELUMP|nr:acetolactate synthase small subunit [Elusimicrobium minutum]ACC98659.1 Acetolactate synthase small subunit [Elusimicrobium minutum Pei191]